MSTTEHAAWTRLRSHGRWYYVLRHGVLTKGIGFAVVMSVIQWFGLFGSTVRNPTEIAVRFVGLALLYGTINGWLEWRSSEDRYGAGAESDHSEPESLCLACGTVLPEGQTRCPACGWSYEEQV